MARAFARIAVGLTLLLAACPGRLETGVDDGGVADDVGFDDGPEVLTDGFAVETGPIDTGPIETPIDTGSSCPATLPSYGPCPREGVRCGYPNGCGGETVADCFTYWRFSSDPCPGCPATEPVAASSCSAVITCPYVNLCGTTDTTTCDGKTWSVSAGTCTLPTCPPSVPLPGSACTPPISCGYPSGCGEPHQAICASSTWMVAFAECPPPPVSVCPIELPVHGSACTGTSQCVWDNGCGNVIKGHCSDSRWALEPSACTPGCPASKSASGAACSTASSTSCTYLVPDTTICTSSCFCAEDLRWACVTPPCAVPPGR